MFQLNAAIGASGWSQVSNFYSGGLYLFASAVCTEATSFCLHSIASPFGGVQFIGGHTMNKFMAALKAKLNKMPTNTEYSRLARWRRNLNNK